ncbi:MAG: hypothetical protein JWQ56_1575 [Pseudarthrobacter sp.]|nr:hypothetical protein [Pseudarthrobacter sp.]
MAVWPTTSFEPKPKAAIDMSVRSPMTRPVSGANDHLCPLSCTKRLRAADRHAHRDADEAYVLWNLWDELTSNYIPPRTDAEIWADVERYLHSCD